MEALLNTDFNNGLSTKEVERRLKEYGLNVLSEKKRKSVLIRIIEGLNDFSTRLLIGVGILSALIGQIPEAIAIGGIVLLETALSIIQQYKAENSIYALKDMMVDKAKVLRSGTLQRVDAKQLVPGDIIYLEAGDKVPADARIIECFDLKTSEASLNGESTPIEKSSDICEENVVLTERTNMLFMGSSVLSGRAKAVVVATGMKTELGKIASILQSISGELTPLQIKMHSFVNKITRLCLVVCFLVGGIGLLTGRTLQQILTNAVGFSIGAIPESLPAVLTVTMALSVQKLARHNVIVRKLTAVEGLSSVNVICCDKTGTLTMNQMTVKKIYASGKFYNVTGSGYSPEGEVISEDKEADDYILSKIIIAGILCNNANLKKTDNKWSVEGDPTEGALLTLAYKYKIDVGDIRSRYKRLHEIPFDSNRRYMTVLVKDDKEKLAFCKGAFSSISKKCSLIYDNGIERLFTSSDKERVQSICDSLGENALRVIAFGYKKVSKDVDLEHNFVFMGLVAMEDPPRDGVIEAIMKCRRAGIKVVMITGDNKTTAAAIGRQLGLLTDGRVVSGTELEGMSDSELDEVIKDIAIFARTSPEQKYRIVKAFKRRGYVVAMTGDGVNDAPAIKEANIGIAMGRCGSDVAKDVASITLVDDNFATIVNAIEESRNVSYKIRNIMKYLLVGSLGEVITITLTSLMFGSMPFMAVQLLWLNVIAETILGATLAMEDTYSVPLDKQEYISNDKLIDKSLAKEIALRGAGMGLTTALLFQGSLFLGLSPARARTLAFSNLVLAHIVNVYDFRHNKDTKPSLYINLAALFSFASLLTMIYVPSFYRFFVTAPLSFIDWVILSTSTTLSRV
ncbi:MAG: cation-translocating P-type ATPase [Caloramator sp.]|nr:cation-translocating P-type ATPase [Caloramator sp.]